MLKAKFHDCAAGWIRLTITTEDQEASIHASAVFDCFPEFIQWMETLMSDTPKDSFYWSGEGEGWDFILKNGFFVLNDPIKERGVLLERPMERNQLVRILYEAFLSFIQSDEYKPEEWERFTYGEEWEKAVQGKKSRHEILEYLLTLNSEDLVQAEFRLNPVYRTEFRNASGDEGVARFVDHVLNPEDKSLTFGMFQEPDYMDLPEEFDDWSFDKRKEWLSEYMNEYDPFSGFGGAKLKELRSFKIERAFQLGNDTKG